MRSTRVGWALGVGRVGGILGPIVVGAALAANWSPSTVFYAMSVPMLAAGLAVLLLGVRYGRSVNDSARSGGPADAQTPAAALGNGRTVGPDTVT